MAEPKITNAGVRATLWHSCLICKQPPAKETDQEDISCTIVTPDVHVCHASFVLAGGQINALASIPIAATTFSAAVIGGTGAYVGVSGQVNNVVTSPGVSTGPMDSRSRSTTDPATRPERFAG